MSAFDLRQFRDALGSFATGVTVVTTRQQDGTPVGLTATSFNSVSLDPPLVLWSLQRDSSLAQAFLSATHFAVHVLSDEQANLSQRFAARDVDRFTGLDVRAGELGSPLLDGCAARFECAKYAEYDGGDHIIMVGEVVALEHRDTRPLAYYRSRYAGLTVPARNAEG